MLSWTSPHLKTSSELADYLISPLIFSIILKVYSIQNSKTDAPLLNHPLKINDPTTTQITQKDNLPKMLLLYR